MPTTGVGIHSKDPVKIDVIPAPHEKEFSIHRLEDMVVWTQVFVGQLSKGGADLEPGWVGDFSTLKDDATSPIRL
jgi:hypothetical protein